MAKDKGDPEPTRAHELGHMNRTDLVILYNKLVVPQGRGQGGGRGNKPGSRAKGAAKPYEAVPNMSKEQLIAAILKAEGR